MEKVRLGRTELMVTKTAFGALPIQRISREDAVKLVRRAYEAGINYFDTANLYTDSEEKLGEALEGVRQNVVISTKGRQSRQTTWELGSSLIVGRASICDVSVEDLEMSRQHFCLEWENGSVYVTDLGSTNGTSVNGIKIASKRRIEPGDHIEAGAMKFTIRW